MRRIFLQCVVFLTLLTASVFLWAADATANTAADSGTLPVPAKKIMTTGTDAASVVVGLFAVVALILLLAFVVKRFNPAVLKKNTLLNVLASQSLGQRERIVLVAVGEQQLLIGVTAQQITLLHTLAEPLPISDSTQSTFAVQLQDVLMRRGA